jgi:hypothetical protein
MALLRRALVGAERVLRTAARELRADRTSVARTRRDGLERRDVPVEGVPPDVLEQIVRKGIEAVARYGTDRLVFDEERSDCAELLGLPRDES